MKLYIVAILAYLLVSPIATGQNLSGDWIGIAPQDKQSFVFTMETNMQQSGNMLSGTSKFTTPDNKWVVSKFRGSITGNKFDITHYEVANHTPGYWCLSRFEGTLSFNAVSNQYIIDGYYTSVKLFDGKRYYDGPCPGGRFKLSKSVPIVSEQRSTSTQAVVSGKVFDKQTHKPVKTTLSIIGEKSPEQLIPSNSDGIYTFKVPIGDVSHVSIAQSGYETLVEFINAESPNQTKNFFLVASSTSPTSHIDNEATKAELEPRRLKNVLFELTTATLLPESFAELNLMANLMKEKPSMKIRLEGHTDHVGDARANLELSRKRAVSVKDYLTKKGINGDRIATKGYGDTKPICPQSCEANRRVEFVVLEP